MKKRFKFFRTLWGDFFPPRRVVQDDGIHAKLNYQSIADAQRRSMSLLLVVIVVFSVGFIVWVYCLSKSDTLVAPEDVANYADYMNIIENKVLGDKVGSETGILTEEEKMLEDNTSLYWNIFFFRFMLVRILIGITVGIIIAFLIRIYFRIRNDRAVNIHKEEALSTIQYVARGEWRLKYNEAMKKYEDVDYILDKKNDVLTTEKFLKTLPIATLFKAPSSEKSRRGNSKPDKELVETMKQIVATLSNIEEELHDMRKKK